MKTVLLVSLFIIFYTFAGYGIFLYLLIRIRRIFTKGRQSADIDPDKLPACTLVITAYNEELVIKDKIINSLALKYPDGKLEIVIVTDGSFDKTTEIVASYPQIRLLHQDLRAGKIAAVNRAMGFVDTEAVIFTDANTFLNPDALVNICRHYADETVGAVAGEKRVHIDQDADPNAAGEGFYWKYESALKKWDSELYSVVGAAGELFSIRRSVYEPVPDDTVLDDFMISMLIASKGYRIIYEPDAYATETASENVNEELKRRIRIAAGGIQSILRLKGLLVPFKYPLLSFQYISHRVLRWTITPFLIILSFILNAILLIQDNALGYELLFAAQILFYVLAVFGLVMERKQKRIKMLFIPYYFCVMNYAVLAGMVRYFGSKQSAIWEKVQRKEQFNIPG